MDNNRRCEPGHGSLSQHLFVAVNFLLLLLDHEFLLVELKKLKSIMLSLEGALHLDLELDFLGFLLLYLELNAVDLSLLFLHKIIKIHAIVLIGYSAAWDLRLESQLYAKFC